VSDLEASIRTVRDRIAGACAAAGRPGGQVRLIAASKGVSVETLRSAVALGLTDIGENYMQEARKKIEELGEGPTWHMIGHVQLNKAKYVSRLFSWVHSVDRWELLEALEDRGSPMRALFEVNLSGEASKHGTDEEGLKRMLDRIRELECVVPSGLMTMPPPSPDPEDSRPFYARLRTLLDRVNGQFGLKMEELSMGMSSDFDVAIEEGATMVRVGTALFGGRQ
jgi:pyridoxal phosphate enzyme (YggS family)